MPEFISPTYNRTPSRRISPKAMLVGGLLLFALIAAGVMMLLTQANNPTGDMDRLNARLAHLEEVIQLGQKHARDPQLTKITTDAYILIIGDISAIAEATKAAGAEGKSKDAIAAENKAEILEELNTAAVNGLFDDAYRNELVRSLESTQSLIKRVHDRTSKRELKAALETGFTHCGQIVAQLEEISG